MNRYLFPIVGFLCCLLGGCAFHTSEEITYNPYIEAFTSGEVSRYTQPTLILAEPIPAGKAGEWEKQIQITPEPEGRWTFDGQRTFIFKPAQALKRDTRYQLSVDLSAWRDIPEKKYRKFKHTFRTVAPRVRADWVSLDMNSTHPENYNVVYAIYTSDKELPEIVEPLIGVTEKADMRWQHSANGRKHQLTLENIRPGKRDIKLYVLPNKLGILEDDLIQTGIPDAKDFSVYRVNYVREPERYVEVVFTQPLDETQSLQGLAYLAGNTQGIVTTTENKLRLYPENKEIRSLEVILKAELKSKSGQLLEKEVSWPIQENEGLPAVRFIGEGVILPQSARLSVPFQAIELKGVIVRVLKIGEQNIGQFLQTNQLDQTGELMRVGRLVTRQVLFLDEQSYDLKRWNTFALDLNQLIQPEPGAIYRVILSFDETLCALTCPDGREYTKEEIRAKNEIAFQEEVNRFDEGGWYYQEDANTDWSLYRYQDRNNPCTPSYYFNKSVGKNILATNIGLMAMAGTDGKMLVLAHHLRNTEPIEGVSVQAYNYQRQLLAEGLTDRHGMLTFDLKKAGGKPFYLLASTGKQRSYLRVDDASALSLSTFDVEGEVLQRGVKGFIYGERGVWRPGDTLHIGFMLYDKGKMLPEHHPVRLGIYNPLGQLYQQKVSTEGASGLYTFHIPTEADVPTGAWMAKVEVGSASFEKRFRIESIKPNRLKIQLKAPKYLLRDEALDIPLHVEWLQGAKARNLKFDLQGTFISTETTFDNFKEYQFSNPAQVFNSEESQLITGRTDAEGNATIQARLQVGTTAPGMLLGNFVTKVYEESGDFSIDAVRMLYSPYKRYIGIRSPQKGEQPLSTDKEYSYQLVSVDYQGNPVGNADLSVDIYKVDWYWWWSADRNALANYVSGSYNKPVKHLDIRTDGQGNASFPLRFAREEWGTYLILVKDKQGGHTTGLTCYYDWPELEGRRDRNGADNASILTFKTDKETYRPGETIHVSIPSSEGSRAIVSVQTGTKILSVEEYVCQDNETSLEIPVTSEMEPNAYLFISLIQPHGNTENDLPIRMYGVVPFEVISEESRLLPQIETANEWKPESTCTLTVSEKSGREMAYTLAIVDEGLLDLTRFQTPDPWTAFHAREALGVHTWDLYDYVLGAYGGRIEQLFSIGGDDALNKGPKAVVNRFTPVVRFSGPYRLGKGERKAHTLFLPNYNGRVRVMVVATDGMAYGNAEKSVMVRKPVMLLGTLPRVIGTDEEMEIPATVFATEEQVGDVQVRIQTSDEMEVIGSSTCQLHFEAQEDRTVTFRVKVKDKPGKGHVTLTAIGKGEKSTYETDLEIRSVSTRQVKVLHETIDAGETWNKEISLDGQPGSNRVELEVARIRPLNLTGRLQELNDYPHGCLEQIVSKAFPQVYLSRFMELTDEQARISETNVKQAISRLRSYQTASGSFAYWAGQTGTNAWGSIYALHFLLEAEAQGYAIPSSMKQQALTDLRKIASTWKESSDKRIRESEVLIQAYRLYVVALAGQADVGAMNRLKALEISPLGKEMLALAYAQIGRSDVANALINQTQEADSSVLNGRDETFSSELRDDAIRLLLRCALDKEPEMLPLVNRLSETLSSDRWLNTQETAFAILALADYYGKYQPEPGEMKFVYRHQDIEESIRTPETVWADRPLQEGNLGMFPLQIRNEGNVPLHLLAKISGESSQENIPASQNGLRISVDYRTTDGHSLSVSELGQGTNFEAWITIQNPTARPLSHLALTAIFPSGWEILNTRFLPVATEKVKVDYQDIRDDRVLSYVDYLPAGNQVTVRINLCAVYSGRFYLPPITCETMYDSAIRANTSSGWVQVK